MKPEAVRQMELACRALFTPGQITELRIFGIEGNKGFTFNAAGWFDNHEQLVAAAHSYEQRGAAGIYVIPNQLHDGCLNRSCNKVIERCDKTTSDRDVITRNWLMIDIDPLRPSEISSNDQELVAARTIGRNVAGWLEQELGWPAGLRALSGNGVHLFYRINLANNDEAKQLVTDCLAALRDRFNAPTVEIDSTCSNAARIMKLWGTIARKGVSTEDRPHRRSQLLKLNGAYPTFEEIEVVTIDKIDGLARLARSTPATEKKKKERAAERARRAATPSAKNKRTAGAKPDKSGFYFDLEEFISKFGIAVKETEPYDGGVRYILEHCIFDESHRRTSAALGRTVDGKIFYKCQHSSCKGLGWSHVRTRFEGPRSSDAGEGENDEWPTDPWEMAMRLVSEEMTDPDTAEVILRRHRAEYFSYDNRIHAYQRISADEMGNRIYHWLGGRVEKLTKRVVTDVTHAINALITLDEAAEPPFMSKIVAEDGKPRIVTERGKRNLITLRNGLLDIDSIIEGRPVEECLRPHTANWFNRTSLPFNFPTTEQQQQCERWIQFLQEIFQGDAELIAVTQEMFAYTLMNVRLERFFILHGGGNNGKSTLLNVLIELLGEDNVSSLSIKQLNNDTMPAAMYGKLANICADLPESDNVAEEILKKIASEDLLTADRKYMAPLQWRPRTRMIFSTNVLPRFVDTTKGIWRRLMLIPFEAEVPAERIDPYLLERLREELPGILLWTLEGVVRLAQDGNFTRCKHIEKRTRDYKIYCFPIFAFLDECTDAGTSPHHNVAAGRLYAEYRRWCRAAGLTKPKPIKGFLTDIETFAPGVKLAKQKPGTEHITIVKGLRIQKDLDYGDGEDDSGPSQAQIEYWQH